MNIHSRPGVMPITKTFAELNRSVVPRCCVSTAVSCIFELPLIITRREWAPGRWKVVQARPRRNTSIGMMQMLCSCSTQYLYAVVSISSIFNIPVNHAFAIAITHIRGNFTVYSNQLRPEGE